MVARHAPGLAGLAGLARLVSLRGCLDWLFRRRECIDGGVCGRTYVVRGFRAIGAFDATRRSLGTIDHPHRPQPLGEALEDACSSDAILACEIAPQVVLETRDGGVGHDGCWLGGSVIIRFL